MNYPLLGITLGAALVMGLVSWTDADAAAGAGAGRAAAAAGARMNTNQHLQVNQNVNVNRQINIDVDTRPGNRPVQPVAPVAPIARAAVAAAVVGTIAYSLPPACSEVGVNGVTYHNCGGTWYQPQFAGTQVTYVVVNAPQ